MVKKRKRRAPAARHRLSVSDRMAALGHIIKRTPVGLDLNLLRVVNVARSVDSVGFDHPLAAWSVAEWTNAVCGEAGEAANTAKKLLRIRKRTRGNKDADTEQALLAKLRREAADTVMYCDLLLASEGLSLSDGIIEVYNAKSNEIGFPFNL